MGFEFLILLPDTYGSGLWFSSAPRRTEIVMLAPKVVLLKDRIQIVRHAWRASSASSLMTTARDLSPFSVTMAVCRSRSKSARRDPQPGSLYH
jgi:hypothetical protein